MTWKAEASRSALAHYIMDRLGEVDKQLGGLTDFHLKFLTSYAKLQMSADQSELQIDLPNKKITVIPYGCGKIMFGRLKWLGIKWKMWRKHDERDLPVYLGLRGWTIRFQRMPGKVAVEDGGEHQSPGGMEVSP